MKKEKKDLEGKGKQKGRERRTIAYLVQGTRSEQQDPNLISRTRTEMPEKGSRVGM